ncbi:MAG TPA: TIR domain-containing protein [Pyrinomonadaceae bacterium]|jgi:hypothetical protein
MEERQYDVALSFAGEDRLYVERVAILLRENGIDVFYDNFNKADLWGRNLIDHLGKIYAERSRFIVMFISKHYAEKTWTNHERKFAQERAFKMGEDCILPVRFDDTEISGLPATIGYIDLQNTTEEELVELIVEKVSPENFSEADEESLEDEREDDQDKSEILYSEREKLEPDTHIAYICDLDEGNVIEYVIESEKEMDVMLLDERDYKVWAENDEFETYYEHYENRTNIKGSFTAPETGRYRIVTVNYNSEKISLYIEITLLQS